MVVELAEQDEVMVDSVLPIVDAGLHELVETDHRLTDEVMLFSTPGHSPGHVSVAILSQGRKPPLRATSSITLYNSLIPVSARTSL